MLAGNLLWDRNKAGEHGMQFHQYLSKMGRKIIRVYERKHPKWSIISISNCKAKYSVQRYLAFVI